MASLETTPFGVPKLRGLTNKQRMGGTTHRNEKGQFQIYEDAMKIDFIITSIIYEEVEFFIERLKKKLNEVNIFTLFKKQNSQAFKAKNDILMTLKT